MAPSPLIEATTVRLAGALRVSAAVRLHESILVGVPAVIGWLQPVILLPASAITGLSARQIELILAHELAHIHRRAYLANLVQTVVETCSSATRPPGGCRIAMRVEREHCRPRAVKRAGKAVTAESLVSMRVHGEEPK